MVKWGGLVASVVLLLVWVGSGCMFARCFTADRHFTITLASGQVHLLMVDGPQANRSFDLDQYFVTRRFSMDLWPSAEVHAGFFWRFGLPSWLPLIGVLIPTGVAWRNDRRASHIERANTCLKCGYDFCGLPVGVVCPECGVTPASKVVV